MSKTNQKNNTNKKKNTPTKKKSVAKKNVSNKKVVKNTKGVKNTKKVVEQKKSIDINSIKKNNLKMMFIAIISFGTLFIFASYAWFSTNLNVKINTFQMSVAKNGGLTISLDGINYDTFVEVSEDILINQLKNTYPNNESQWSAVGLTPVSTNGIANSNSDRFEIFASSGVRYKNLDTNNGYIKTVLTKEEGRSNFNNYIAFDLFLKNSTGSPLSDNLYIERNTEISLVEETNEEMEGLFNSIRLGFLRIGSVPLDADVNTVQNMECNNACTSTIYEPNHTKHVGLSIERAQKYGITLVDGEFFPTYGCIKGGGPIYMRDAVSGSPNLDYNYFKLQETIKDDDLENPLFELPNGITKMRIYLWIEGQDIDSLETDSSGTKIDVSINLIKDTAGYEEY